MAKNETIRDLSKKVWEAVDHYARACGGDPSHRHDSADAQGAEIKIWSLINSIIEYWQAHENPLEQLTFVQLSNGQIGVGLPDRGEEGGIWVIKYLPNDMLEEALKTLEDPQGFPSRVKQIICEQLGANRARVTEPAKLDSDLGAESLEQVEVLLALEEEFECEIDDDEASEVRTVRDVIDLVERSVKKEPGIGDSMPRPKDLNRRARVEQRLLEAAAGKADLPNRDECHKLAMDLGVPDEYKEPAQ